MLAAASPPSSNLTFRVPPPSLLSLNGTIFLFQLQLSEVIMRTRKYMTEIVGGGGNVLTHHIKPQDLEKKFEAAHISDQAPVKQFLQRVTSDQEG